MLQAMPGRDCPQTFEQAKAPAGGRAPQTVSFSAKVFIPVTRLCRNRCAYCDYSVEPSEGNLFISPDEALAIARAGERAGCSEALFVAGDKPERRYPTVRAWLRSRGYDSTVHYTRDLCRLVLNETRLYPHTNVGALAYDELLELREVNASLGLMLESAARSLEQRGGSHWRCPDKRVPRRLEAMEAAGKARVLFTTGLLLGIGESREERQESLIEIKRLHERYGHIQEVIIQNVRPRPVEGADRSHGRRSSVGSAPAGTPASAGPTLTDVLETVRMAKRLLGPRMNIQVPPNLALRLTARLELFLKAGANDWGGVSPLTVDHVNPDSPWPNLDWLRTESEAAGYRLRQRFPAYPEFVRAGSPLLAVAVKQKLAKDADPEGYVRDAKYSSRLEPAGGLLGRR